MSLATYIKQHRDEIDERMAIHLVRSVAPVIHEIHQRCFLHRDIKPANILLEKLVSPSKSGLPFRPLVTDFGLAKLIAVGHDATVRSESSSIVGTLRYMSPEQAAGQSRLITVTTDVYSLGVVLYELIAQRPPFHEGSKLALIHSIIHDPAPLLRKAVPRVSRELEAIVAKCLEKNPNERYVSAKAFADDLQFYLEGKSTLARPATPIRSLLVGIEIDTVGTDLLDLVRGCFALGCHRSPLPQGTICPCCEQYGRPLQSRWLENTTNDWPGNWDASLDYFRETQASQRCSE